MSTFYAVNQGEALKESIRFSTYLVLYFVIKYHFADEKKSTGILKSYLFSCILISLLGLLQYVFFVWPYIQQHLPVPIYKIGSVLENSNNVGAFFTLVIFPLILLTLKTNNLKYKIVYGSITCLVLMNIFLSFSRNAWIALATGCILLIIIHNWKLIFLFAVAAGFALKIPLVYNRILQFADISQNSSRIKIWGVAIEVIRNNFWLGVGNANFSDVYNEYSTKFDYITYEFAPGLHPHNIFLKIQSELGVLGSLAFISFLISGFKMLRRFAQSASSDFLQHFYQGYLISFLVFIQMNLLDNFFSAPKVRIYFFIFLAIADGLLNREVRKTAV
ncbi:MAG: O-antigen ligase family protein [Desulfitobacteriaceae bacterium]|nr:O-antigen ligase family protein [Desulfitobacteriaceae bacterium]